MSPVITRKLLLGVSLTCFIQSGVFLVPPSYSYAKEIAGSAKANSIDAEIYLENTSDSEILSNDDPVDLLADSVEYDENAGIVRAVGNVELVQLGRILRADEVSYDLGQDKVSAIGNVVLNETTGETYFADDVELKDKMKDGFVNGLRGVLADGSRFTAEQAEKVADLKLIMSKASYTPCEPCKANPDAAPIWAIKARNVTHHKNEQRVSYKDATFEVLGTPIAYAPYFSHADGSVEQKNGFLMPSVGFDSDLGMSYEQNYYWGLAPDKDLTLGAMVMTEENPLLMGEYRQRFENAEFQMNGGVTYSSRIDRIGDTDIVREEEERGHFFADGLWNLNDKWRAGTSLKLVSDDQYLRQYNVTTEDVLENKVYAERFSGRNYALGQVIRFKDIRVSDRAENQPNVLPEIYSRFLGDPNDFLGGRWSLEASALGLEREGSDQDLSRGTVEMGWQKRHVNNIGLVNTLDLNVRGDAYHSTDREISTDNNGRSDDSSALRGFAQAHLKSGYPLQKQFETSQVVVEPIGALTIGTNVKNDTDIPNEDSEDVFLDVTNLYNANRFPGYDRIEDSSRATYGLRTGLYTDSGYQAEVFAGQSYRFNADNDENPFPQGSGLSEQESDLVGNISLKAQNRLYLNYGIQLDNKHLSSQRHELDASGSVGKVSLGTRYFYINSLQGTDFDESREQISGNLTYEFKDDWFVFGTSQYDLAEETEGLRSLSYGLDYQGQCVTFRVSGQRTLTRDSTGDSGTQIMMRLGLKNLGEFQTSGFTVGSSDE